ncbi:MULTISPECIES: radical SAM family heme chaperone HemW [Eubacterium]|jgi:oxygen-independent coproporphyrinogen-3 oxidase|uniref:Heme chaperone HemW n=1 Tax=Eubacterium ruminantium TaxID=42322 RepID=A0A1T4LQ69_9FIRM|nr:MULTISPECIES: radical SAM family heme chaperone HemW [Eubacterium]MCR5368444.1 radical SAM family heme chaperone HemW [Eubacterium sp.]SCW40509.1 oxygen-independent coproporphyrinogen-3 oxidase [Eubacterium ruminantium]SDM39196.1 oxygen-independent coproporphyrinogen-3 oxidase [Eubacterium ruminantium]SJZ56870.1 oxygen-independent coproporphyrinogen-3 oxidase [Eubacterium ruminantium]
MKKNLGIYVHIPFCVSKCSYCDFLSFDNCSYAVQLQYIDALIQEIKLYKAFADRYVVKTIFFGGGTPSLLDEVFIGNILKAIRSVFNVDRFPEITIEANPGTVKYTNLLAYQSHGINRLSIGLQSTDDDCLMMLGRIHNMDQFVATYNSARRAGFKNINVDIMSGIPGQTEHTYVETLMKVIEFGPEHISAYSLQVEDGTPLAENEPVLSMLPDEEADRRMYAMTKKVLGANGYQRYEFSNYAKPGYECKHNITYWTGGEYVGLGLGAASFFKGERFSNIRDINRYLEIMQEAQSDIASSTDKISVYDEVTHQLRENIETMYIDSRIEEFMFLGLRMTKGVSRSEFLNRFNKDIYEVYGPVINKYVTEGFMVEEGDSIRLNDRGIDVSNIILSDFILD